MTIERAPRSGAQYYLISYDAESRERTDDPSAPNGRLSEVVLEAAGSETVTDIFLMSHGNLGDVPAAIQQCNDWIDAMSACAEDRERIRSVRPGFEPLLIGLHWPSLPFGDEELSGDAVSFGAGEDGLGEMLDRAAEGIADTPRAREALEVIFGSAMQDMTPSELPEEVAAAYAVLAEEAEVGGGGPGAPPGDDGEPFDAASSYEAALEAEELSYGAGSAVLAGLLAPLRVLSFWKMKKRARAFGETAVSGLLGDLQRRTSPAVRIHLMGHSFGCIVCSAAVAGPGGRSALLRPVDSMILAQGAFSLWAMCEQLPVAPGKRGYFHSILRDRRVAGPLLTTQSVHDTAVVRLYPLAAGIAGQVSFAPGELPTYGAIGSHGVRGVEVEDLDLLPVGEQYEFEPGKVYNLESSHVICEGRGPSGAHNDIAKPEVAHAFWAAIMSQTSREAGRKRAVE